MLAKFLVALHEKMAMADFHQSPWNLNLLIINLINNVEDIIVVLGLKYFILKIPICFMQQNAQLTVRREITVENNNYFQIY